LSTKSDTIDEVIHTPSHYEDMPRPMTLPRAWQRVLLSAAAALLLASAPTSSRAATHQVDIVDFAFSPAELTITVGDTVTWTNRDQMIHTATSVNGAFDSGDLDVGESYSLTFTAPGTYDYLCTPHPSMTGRIVVVAAAATPAPSSGEIPNVAMPLTPGSGPLLVIMGLIAIAAAGGVAIRLARVPARRS
jgi:amicyanin